MGDKASKLIHASYHASYVVTGPVVLNKKVCHSVIYRAGQTIKLLYCWCNFVSCAPSSL